MKTRILIASLSVLLISAACSKEEEKPEPRFPQELIIDGERFPMEAGFIMHFPDANASPYSQEMVLYTEGISIDYDSTGFPSGVKGHGYFLAFEAWSSDSLGLAEGVYRLDTARSPFSLGLSSLNPVVFNNSDLWFILQSAEFEVIRDGETYTIVGVAKDESDLDIQFSYQGSLDFHRER